MMAAFLAVKVLLLAFGSGAPSIAFKLGRPSVEFRLISLHLLALGFGQNFVKFVENCLQRIGVRVGGIDDCASVRNIVIFSMTLGEVKCG